MLTNSRNPRSQDSREASSTGLSVQGDLSEYTYILLSPYNESKEAAWAHKPNANLPSALSNGVRKVKGRHAIRAARAVKEDCQRRVVESNLVAAYKRLQHHAPNALDACVRDDDPALWRPGMLSKMLTSRLNSNGPTGPGSWVLGAAS